MTLYLLGGWCPGSISSKSAMTGCTMYTLEQLEIFVVRVSLVLNLVCSFLMTPKPFQKICHNKKWNCDSAFNSSHLRYQAPGATWQVRSGWVKWDGGNPLTCPKAYDGYLLQAWVTWIQKWNKFWCFCFESNLTTVSFWLEAFNSGCGCLPSQFLHLLALGGMMVTQSLARNSRPAM